MENFIFQNCTRIVFGRNTEENLAPEIKKHGRRILLHYDGDGSSASFIKRCGLYDRIRGILAQAEIDVVDLPGVQPNPRLSLVREGTRVCRDEKIDCILAVGGGSVIDSAKSISIGVPYEGDVWDLFLQKAAVASALPVGVVLTLPASGSESSPAAVLTNEDGYYKRDVESELLRPKFAILNPELTYTLSSQQTAIGATDIICHVLERYFTNTRNVDLSDRLCEATVNAVVANTPLALKDPRNYDARAEIMWAGTIAHNDLLGRGRIEDWGSHYVGHEIGALYDIAHGVTMSIIMLAWMKYVYRGFPERFAQYAVRVWDCKTGSGALERVALNGIEKNEGFFRRIGMPTTLKEVGVPRDRFGEIAAKAVDRGPIGNLVKLHKTDVLNILEIAAG